MLLGGLGKDSLHGGAGDDVLMPGTIISNRAVTNLTRAHVEWQSADDYTTRSEAVTLELVPETDIPDDATTDTLHGGEGTDLFYARETGSDADELFKDVDELLNAI